MVHTVVSSGAIRITACPLAPKTTQVFFIVGANGVATGVI